MSDGSPVPVTVADPAASAEASVAGARVVLADGRIALLRELRPQDQAGVLRLHQQLPRRDQYFRFFGPLPPKAAELVRGMSEPVNARHGSVGVFLGPTPLGVANYEVLADPTVAEVALAVSGTAQTHGVGTLLLEYLASLARRHGVRRFVAEVLSENSRMLRMFHASGLSCHTNYEGSVTHVEMALDETSAYLDAMGERERGADAVNLRALLRPASLVVLGAEPTADSAGRAVLANLQTGGYTGQLYVVDSHLEQIGGVASVPTIEALPVACELAVLCVPAGRVADTARRCGQRGVQVLVVISPGSSLDREQQDELLAEVGRYGMRLVGPGSLGVANTDPSVAMDATIAASRAPGGSIGLISQAGGIGIALRGQLAHLGLGLSTMVSTGDKHDVSGNDLLLWWRHDEATTAAVLCLESFGNPRKFVRLCQSLAQTKPVLALRTATSGSAPRATTARMATPTISTARRDALFRQAGVIAVDTATALVGTLATLSWQPLPRGNKIAVITNAGAGMLRAGECAHADVVLAILQPATVTVLRTLLTEPVSVANPVRTTALVAEDTFARAVATLLADPGVDAVVATTIRTAVGDPIDGLTALAPGEKPVLAVRLGQPGAVEALRDTGGITRTASYAEPAEAVAVLGRLNSYARWLTRPTPSPTQAQDVDVPRALGVLREHLRVAAAGDWLSPMNSLDLIDCFGIPHLAWRFARDEEEVVAAFSELGRPLVMNAVLESQACGVPSTGVSGVRDSDQAVAALRELTEQFRAALCGVLLQPTAPPGRELLIKVHSDGVFGPLVEFGLGGADTNMAADRIARLSPLAETDAEELLHALPCSEALFGARSTPSPTFLAARAVLLRASLLADLLPEVTDLELNPLIVGPDSGAVVVHARVRAAPSTAPDPLLPGAARLSSCGSAPIT
jgi:acyl-CoA synthetase (NDP forming)/GNAT superfamily N-acetyltransferase